MNRKAITVLWASAAFAVCGFAARSASAQTCSADAECAAGTTCVATAATGCIDTCANNGGCVGMACGYIKTCIASCSQDSDCEGGKYCQLIPPTVSCPRSGAGGTSGSASQGCTEPPAFGQCMYHPLGALPEGGAGGQNAGEPTSPAGAPNGEGISEEGGSAGQTNATPVTQGAAPSEGTPTSASGGCAVAFGATNASSAGLLMFGLGAVVALRRRRDERRITGRSRAALR